MTEPSPVGSDTGQESVTSHREELSHGAGPPEDETATFSSIFSSRPEDYTATDTVAAFQLLAQRRQDGALASTSEAKDHKAITQLVQVFLRQVSNLPWRDLTSICNSLATYSGSYEFGAMLQALETQAVRRLKAGDSPKSGQSFSTLLHTFAVVRGHKPSRDFLSVVTEGLRAGLKDLFPQDFVDTAQAYAVLEHYPGVTFATELAQAFSQQVAKCKIAQLSKFLSAYVALRHYPGKGVLEAIFAETLRHPRSGELSRYSVSDISTLIWAGASFGHGDIIKRLGPLMMHSAPSDLEPSDLARMLWGMAVMDALTEDVVQSLGELCAWRRAESNFTGAACRWMIGAQLAVRTVTSYLPPILQKEIEQALTLWRQRAAETKPHAAATAVAETLREMSMDAVEQYQMDRGALVADIALPDSQTVLLLEDDTSFCINQRRHPMGQTILRRRWFEKWKWEKGPGEGKPITVVSLAVDDWEALQSSAQRREFLQRTLQGPPPMTQIPPLLTHLPGVADASLASSAAMMEAMMEAQLSMHSRSGSAESMAGVYPMGSGSGITAETMASLKLAGAFCGVSSLGLEPSLESSGRFTDASSTPTTDSSPMALISLAQN